MKNKLFIQYQNFLPQLGECKFKKQSNNSKSPDEISTRVWIGITGLVGLVE